MKPGPHGGAAAVGGTINVYFHVIARGVSQGDGWLSAQQGNAQMTVLNQAFQSTGWSFNLVATDYTLNTGSG